MKNLKNFTFHARRDPRPFSKFGFPLGSISSEGDRSRPLFERLFEEIPEGIALTDAAHRILRVNRAFREIFGYTDAEVTGRPIDDVVATVATVASEAREISLRVQDGEPCALPHTWRTRKDGTLVEVALSVVTLTGPDGILHYGLYRDISAQRQTERALHRRLEMGQLLTRISARFLDTLDLDGAIDTALGELGSFYGADRGYVFQIDPGGATQSNTHEWCAPGVVPEKDRLQHLPLEASPWWINTLRRHGALRIDDVETLPAEADAERSMLRDQGIRSLFVLSWSSGDAMEGFVGFDNTQRPQAWVPEDLEELRFFCDFLGSALRKRSAERALRRSERRYEAMVQDQEDLVCRFSPGGRLLFANRAFLSFFDLDHRNLPHLSVLRCVPSPERLHFLEEVRSLSPEAPSLFRTDEFAVAGENSRWIQWNNVGIFDDQGNLSEIQGVGRDISERILAEQTLRESRDHLERRVEERTAQLAATNLELRKEIDRRRHTEEALKAQIRYTEAILRTIPDTVLVFDQEGTVTDVVTHAATPLPHRLPTGQTLEEFLPSEAVPRVREAIDRTLRSRELGTVEYTNDARRSFEARLAPLCRGDRECDRVVCLNVDITRRKEIEDALRSARDAAEAASRAKSVFLANMSHEVRTPLNAVLGMARLLRDSSLSEDQQELLLPILGAGEKLLALLNNLLILAHLESDGAVPAQNPIDLRRLIHDLSRGAEDAARKKDLSFVSSVARDIPETVLGDPELLRTCLDVLLANAVAFTGQGQVALTVSPEEHAFARYRFSVTDTGIGIAPEDVPRLFQPFSQVDDSMRKRHQGAGIGLAIAQRIVRALGGDLQVASVPGQGSAFSFSLSLPPGPLPENGPLFPLPPRLRILVAEDNPVDRKLVQLMLRKEGADLRVVETGKQALEALAEERFDLALVDIHLPEMDGLETAGAIRLRERQEKRSHLPLVAMTAFAVTGDPAQCAAAGMDGFLGKPFTAEELRKAIVTALRSVPKTAET